MDCKYKKTNGRCELLTTLCDQNGFHVPDSFCADRCWPNHAPAQVKMLRRFNISLPGPPEGKDLLAWAKECVANGTVKLSDAAISAQQRKKEAEDHRQKLLAEMPKGFHLTANLMSHLAEIHRYYKKTKEEGKLGLDGKPGQYYVSEKHELARLRKCGNCPDGKMVIDDNGVMRCALKTCGCYLNNPNNRPLLEGKAKYIALGCDNGHWVEIDAAFSATEVGNN